MMKKCALVIVAAMFVVSSVASAAESRLAKPVSIIDRNLRSFQTGGDAQFFPPDANGSKSTDDYEKRVVPVKDMPFKQATRMRIKRKTPQAYSVEMLAFTTKPIKRDDVILLTFYLRGLETLHESGEVMVRARFQRHGWPWTALMSADVTASVGQGWKKFQFPFPCLEDYAAGKALLTFHLGFGPQVLEIGGLELVNYGKSVKVDDLPMTRFSYPGREPDAPWRKAADQRIEKHRKQDLKISVVDATGRPVPGVKVEVQMTRHAFSFGSEANVPTIMGVEEGMGGRKLDRLADTEKYRKMVLKLFNTITIGHTIAWRQWESSPAEKATALATLDWGNQNGLRVIGHQLFWPVRYALPNDLKWLEVSGETLQKRIMDHITDKVSATRGKWYAWVVVNEPSRGYAFQVYETLAGKNMAPIDSTGEGRDERQWVETTGGIDKMAEWFKTARALDPKAKLVLNEVGMLAGGGNRKKIELFSRLYERLLACGAPIDVIAEEGHFRQNLTDPGKVVEILDGLYAKFGKEFWITEFDVNTLDDQLQADYLRDFLTACFSHPSVGAFIMWDFWEKTHWQPQAALYRTDWTIKPAGKVWEDLVLNKWWTNETGKTDPQGKFQTRAFLGDYTIRVTRGSKTAEVKTSLPKQGSSVKITLN